MATEVLLPKQGNTVESCIILEWKKQEGETVSEGEPVCEVETDKATFDVESPVSGTLLKRFFDEGDDVPVLTVIAAVGEEGEDVSGLAPSTAEASGAGGPAGPAEAPEAAASVPGPAEAPEPATAPAAVPEQPAAGPRPDRKEGGPSPISPRARLIAQAKGVDPSTIAGTGPGGRVIERDIRYVLGTREPFTPAAIEEQLSAGGAGPARGTGIGGRVTAADIAAAPVQAGTADQAGTAPGTEYGMTAAFPGPSTDTPVKGIRKLIAERMQASLQSTAQLTLNSSADARAIIAFRKRLKNTPEGSGYRGITVNDLVMYAVSRTILEFPDLNSHFLGETVRRFDHVHLGFAVDTPRGLMVPVVRNAHLLTLKQLSDEAKRLAAGCLGGKITPEELKGGTFTVTNLGAFGIESFTPIANAPEVGILGINTIAPKPVTDENGCTDFIPHIGFSLTTDHQLIDGALGARFLKSLAEKIADFEILLAG